MELVSKMATPVFFILGRPRSGTTLLKTLFDAHPNVRIAPELPILLPLYQKYRKIKDWDENTILSFIDDVFRPAVFNNRRIENFRIDRIAFTDDLLRLAHRGSVNDFLMKMHEHSYSVFPKGEMMIIGDKNPVYSVYTRRLVKIFPQARFICIVRDYRDNFISLRNLEGTPMEAPVLSLQICRWRYITRLFTEMKRRFPERVRVVRYEDLVLEPETTFAELCSFLGIPYNDNVFRFHEKKEDILSAFSNPVIEKIHKSLLSPINTGRIELWTRELNDKEIRIADQLANNMAREMHYRRVYRGFNFLVYLKTRPMALYTILLFRLMVLGTYLPYRTNRKAALKLTKLVRIYGSWNSKRKKGDQVK